MILWLSEKKDYIATLNCMLSEINTFFGVIMHTKYCSKCPYGLAKQCELDLGQNTMPPCAKRVEESVNSLQQLKAEIRALLKKHFSPEPDVTYISFRSELYERLRELSAV